MKIADHPLGPGHPVFLVAELGITACGDVKRACALVDAVADAGVPAAKFIVTDPSKTMASRALEFAYDVMSGPAVAVRDDEGEVHYLPPVMRATRPLYDLLAECTFTFDEWVTIRDYCHTRGLVFFATVDHLDGVDLLEALQVPAYKLSCWDIAYWPLIAKLRTTGKPLLVDIGTATREEVAAVLPVEQNMMFVHDPHPPDWNMGRMRHFFRPDYPVGFSSPGRESWCDFVALGGGACLIEKRLTLRRDETRGHHHAISLEPDEFTAWAKEIRRAEATLRVDEFAGTAQGWADRKTCTRGEDGRIP